VTRQPDNRCGWIMLAFCLSNGIQLFVEGMGIYGYYLAGWPEALIAVCASITGAAWVSSMALVAYLLLIYPTGDFLSKRWRVTGWITAGAVFISILGGVVMPGPMTMVAPIPNPFGLEVLGKVPEVLLSAGAVVIFIMILLGALSIILRFRRSIGEARQQIKWMAYGGLIFGGFLITDFFITLPGLWETVKESLAFSVIPLTIGLAVLRYRLWDIDLIIRKTLVYGVLTAMLALVFFGGVALLQQIFGRISGTENSPIAIVLSTLAIVAISSPLRRRVQDFIDRRFYRQKYNAEKALAEFATVASRETEVNVLSTLLTATVQDALQPERLSLWLLSSMRAETYAQNRVITTSKREH
jgi:hypothetical protein